MTHTLERVPDGFPGVKAKVRRLRDLVEEAKRDPAFRQRTLEVIAGVPERDKWGEVQAMLDWVRSHVTYRRDPIGVETFTGPALMMREAQRGRAWEDCDGHVGLLAAMIETGAGLPVRFRVGGPAPGIYRHIWLEASIPGHGWTALEPTKKDNPPPMGFAQAWPVTATLTGDAMLADIELGKLKIKKLKRLGKKLAKKALKGPPGLPGGMPFAPTPGGQLIAKKLLGGGKKKKRRAPGVAPESQYAPAPDYGPAASIQPLPGYVFGPVPQPSFVVDQVAPIEYRPPVDAGYEPEPTAEPYYPPPPIAFPEEQEPDEDYPGAEFELSILSGLGGLGAPKKKKKKGLKRFSKVLHQVGKVAAPVAGAAANYFVPGSGGLVSQAMGGKGKKKGAPGAAAAAEMPPPEEPKSGGSGLLIAAGVAVAALLFMRR